MHTADVLLFHHTWIMQTCVGISLHAQSRQCKHLLVFHVSLYAQWKLFLVFHYLHNADRCCCSLYKADNLWTFWCCLFLVQRSAVCTHFVFLALCAIPLAHLTYSAVIITSVKRSVWVSLCLCHALSLQNLLRWKLVVNIPWDMRMFCSYSVGNNNNLLTYWLWLCHAREG